MNAILDGLVRLWRLSGNQYRAELEKFVKDKHKSFWADFKKEIKKKES